MEIFKEIKGFEGLYEVSNHGNIKSLITNRLLKLCIESQGYYIVGLCKNRKQISKRVHRLVAETFIPNPDNLSCINHKDENKLNNFVWINDDGSVDLEKSNLEWCTIKYNSNYGTARERSVEKKKKKKNSEETKRKMSESLNKRVVAIDKDGNIVYEFSSIMKVENHGFSYSAVSDCCRKCYMRQGNNYYKRYRWFFKSEWEEMQQATHDRVACGKLNIE